MSEDVNTTLYKILSKYLTKKEVEKLESLTSEHGSVLDVVLVAVRKMINPNLITYDEIEACLQKAIKINAYVSTFNASNTYPSDIPSPSQVAREVAQSVESMNNQQSNNPFAEMFNAFRQQLMNQIMEEMRSRLNIPISVTPNPNSNGDSNVQTKGKVAKKDDIFMGDVDEEEE
jgi:predicted RND superfamily exporter protein